MPEDFGFREMQEIQRQMQERYKERWKPNSPENGRSQLLWLMVELGEAADVIKKSGDRKIMEDEKVRAHFVEEMCDVLMYFNDVMQCYDISMEELRDIYREKYRRNMERW